MKKLILAAIAVLAVSPAFADEDTHCPIVFSCTARTEGSVRYMTAAATGETEDEATLNAIRACEFQAMGQAACRVIGCGYKRQLDVWGACLDGGILNPLFN